jgi:hypothetical protein
MKETPLAHLPHAGLFSLAHWDLNLAPLNQLNTSPSAKERYRPWHRRLFQHKMFFATSTETKSPAGYWDLILSFQEF